MFVAVISKFVAKGTTRDQYPGTTVPIKVLESNGHCALSALSALTQMTRLGALAKNVEPYLSTSGIHRLNALPQ